MRLESDTYRSRCLYKPLPVTQPWLSHRLCGRTQPGSAEDCAAANKSPCTYEVSGCLPFDMDQRLDSDACDAAKESVAVDCEGSDGVGVANIGEPSDSDPEDAGVEVSVFAAERFTTVAASLTRPPTRNPRTPFVRCVSGLRQYGADYVDDAQQRNLFTGFLIYSWLTWQRSFPHFLLLSI